MTTSTEFKQALSAEITRHLGQQFKFLKSRMELRQEVSEGHHVVIISGSNKYSPHIGVDFYYGKCFSAARQIEKRLGIYSFPYHVQQYSPNFRPHGPASYAGPCTWSVDLSQPPSGLAEQLVQAIQGIACPFWDRYGTMLAARDAIALDDPGVFGGPAFWRQLLHLDMALDDLAHFEAWSSKLNKLSRKQADESIQRFLADTDA
jgi:hypothetical protein